MPTLSPVAPPTFDAILVSVSGSLYGAGFGDEWFHPLGKRPLVSGKLKDEISAVPKLVPITAKRFAYVVLLIEAPLHSRYPAGTTDEQYICILPTNVPLLNNWA